MHSIVMVVEHSKKKDEGYHKSKGHFDQTVLGLASSDLITLRPQELSEEGLMSPTDSSLCLKN